LLDCRLIGAILKLRDDFPNAGLTQMLWSGRAVQETLVGAG
jgi:hypothetical protein